MLQDQQQRQKATDPTRSFIVQAPAGSGKTELLTQRYLRLLNTVNEPEQIIALTFTRKAASEMRNRVLLALQQAAVGTLATSPHQQQTATYASQAIQHAKQHDWQLLKQSNRLRIMTIDALCQMLCQTMPLAEKQIPYANLCEQAKQHYEEAARACLAHALANEALHPPLKCLLNHLGNRQDKLLELWSDLLAAREQWLAPLYSARSQEQSHYEQMLAFIEHHALARLQQSTPKAYRENLRHLVQRFASIRHEKTTMFQCLVNWNSFEQLDRRLAQTLANLLLTSQGKLRKSFDHHVGLTRESCEVELYQLLKADSKDLLAALAELPEFLEALQRVQQLPPPHYENEQWQVLQALFTLLPLLIAHLQLIFVEHNEVDFAAISQQALLALGDETQPTDLNLYLDNRIQHLLVDEFQDTSMQQFQLISQLLQGWQPGDGRTLFLVGDPMQSIYRFRQAEVGLFLQAKQQGIGSVKLDFLELCCNFRSSDSLVNWVNHHFQTLMPTLDDIESGAISFHPANPILMQIEDSGVQAWQCFEKQTEAQAVVACVRKELAHYPDTHIAILVRSRHQLPAIIKELRAQQISFQGVEIEKLAQLSHCCDLWSLTQALLSPANRLAWLELLRGPFVGLELADLHVLANVDKKQSLYTALSQWQQLALSPEGKERVRFVYAVFDQALACRYQLSLVDWVRQTAKHLQSDHCFSAIQHQDLEAFWQLLERFTDEYQTLDCEGFKQAFHNSYSQHTNTARLQIMTIHKSKGLEFDCVILPGLSAKSSPSDTPLLRWLKLPSKQYGELFLISPLKAAHQEQSLLYDYLGRLDREKETYELQRLLYVAVTRAKKRLYLFDHQEKATRGSFRDFLKQQIFDTANNPEEIQPLQQELPALYRLPLSFYNKPPALSQPPLANSLSVTTSASVQPNYARQFGLIAHELLQWICDHHPTHSEQLPWQMVQQQFKCLGLAEAEQQQATMSLQAQIKALLTDPIGQWLTQAQQDEKNEYELLVSQSDQIVTRIIDRTFIADSQRWVIDFKTGNDKSSSQAAHQQQVNEYALLFYKLKPQPIQCGLYYLANQQWLHWEFCLL